MRCDAMRRGAANAHAHTEIVRGLLHHDSRSTCMYAYSHDECKHCGSCACTVCVHTFNYYAHQPNAFTFNDGVTFCPSLFIPMLLSNAVQCSQVSYITKQVLTQLSVRTAVHHSSRTAAAAAVHHLTSHFTHNANPRRLDLLYLNITACFETVSGV